jgi:hypothetical protein
MSKLVSVPNLGTVEFPDDTPDEAISSSITDHLDRVGKKAALGEEMAATRRERFAGDVGEAFLSGAEAGTKVVAGMSPIQAISNFGTALGLQSPIPPDHFRQALDYAETIAGQPRTGSEFDEALKSGTKDFLSETASGLIRPDQLALLAAGGTFPTQVGRAFQLAPIPDMPQQISQLSEDIKKGDVASATKSGLGVAMGAALPFVIEHGLNKSAATPKQKAGPNADVTEVLATVRTLTNEDLQAQINALAADPGVTGKKLVSLDAQGNPIYHDQIIDKAKVRQLKNLQDLLAQGEIKTSGGIPAEPTQPARPREENQVPLNGPSIKLGAASDAFAKQGEALVNQMADQVAQGMPVDQLRKIVEQNGNWKPADVDSFIKKVENEAAKRKAPPTEANAPASVPSTETAGVSETAGGKSGEAKAPVAKPLKVGEAPTPADIHAATHEEFMAYHDAMKAPGEQRAAVNEFAKSLDENGIKEAERLAQVSRDKAKEIINGDGPLETRFKQSMEENQRTQFLAEGARTAKAMKAVEEGSTPAEAAKKLGVPVSALEAPKAPAAEVKPPTVEPPKAPEAKTFRFPRPEPKGGWETTTDWRKVFDQTPDLETKIDWLRAVANNKGSKASAVDMADALARTEKLASEQYHSRLGNALHDISQNPASSPEVKARAKSLYDNYTAPTEPVKPVEAAKPTEQSAISERLRKQRARETEDRRVGLFQKLMTLSTDEDLRAAAANVSVEDKQWIKERLDAAPGDAPRIRQALGIAPKEEVAPLSKPVKANGKKTPASKQSELTFEEQNAEQAALNEAHDEPRSYTSATEDESGRLYLNPIGPLIRTTLSDIRDFSHGVKKSAEWIIEKGREAAGLTKEAAKEGFNVGGKMNDYRRSVLNWSMKLQKSFGEAAHAQRDIQKRVPDSIRREAITNWIQADGDNTVLANRAATTTDKRLKKGYEIAQHLTPDEIAIARQIKGVYDALGQRGQAYGVINNFKENYVTQIWNLKNRLGGSARTLKDKFKYAKARTFDSFYDGEQAGYDPKTKDISKLLPSYLHEMNSVIAARQLVKQMQNGVAADGRPLLVPRGTGTPVSGPSGDATLITPKAVKGDTSDYKLLPNQPALNDWVWAAKDQAGNNIFLKADLMVHPKVYDKLKNTLGRSAIQEWYRSDTGPAAMLPKAIVQGLDVANNEAKRTMLGLASPFHQVQEGTHAIGHRVNPFSVPEIDLVGNPEQADAAKHGAMLLPDRASEAQFMEGFRASGLVSRIPILGRIADAYSNYLFHDYIPGLKFKTYQAILERNKSVFAKELANGTATLEDVKVLSAEQSNAAYGHLNYADLGRNPTISHIMRATIIAPDFLEARARFAGQAIKGATGFKVGREQVLALGFLALTQATAAYIIAKSLNGEWDKSHPFEFTKDNKRYTMRSVPEDVTSLIDNPRMFFNNRMTALASTLDQLRTGRDWKGDRISASDTLKEAAQKPLPLPIRAALKMGSKSLSAIEQLAGSFGIKISAADPKIKKGIEIKDRTELLANKLRKLNRIERYKTAKDELKDLPPKDRNTVIDKLRRQGVFTYQ